MSDRRGWFSDIGNDETDSRTYQIMWQPCLELGTGLIPSIDIWFATEAACDDFIKADILGQPFMPLVKGVKVFTWTIED